MVLFTEEGEMAIDARILPTMEFLFIYCNFKDIYMLVYQC